MKQNSKNLWTKDFSCITLATILSAVGGEAMNLPVSLFVFDETQSVLSASLVMICGMLPDILLPVFVAPFIDKSSKKKWIVGLDMLLAILYGGMGLWIGRHEFMFPLYLGFILIVAATSVFYRLAYTAWYPDLIPYGLEQKGYAVSSTIYPLVTIMMSPIAAFLYEKVAMEHIFFLVSGITVLSVLIESRIREKQKNAEGVSTFKQYCREIRDGFSYLKKEKGIRNIYANMGVMQGTSEGMGIITQVYYQTQPWLSVTRLGFLISFEMVGRVLGGMLQYKREVPVGKRYALTKFVYLFYSVADMTILFMPYPAMLVNRAVCGALGISSATIRETAVQSYLPEQMRARVNAFFQVIFAVGGVLFQFLAGVLGMMMPYRAVAVLLGLIGIGSIAALIFLPAEENRSVYEAVREESVT